MKLRFANDGHARPKVQFRCPAGVVRGLSYLPPGATTSFRTELGPGALSGVNVQTQAGLMVPVTGERTATPTLLRVGYDGQRFAPSLSVMPPGPAVIEVANSGTERGSLLLINWPPEIVAQAVKPPLDFEPYMSGGTLLARQTFRRLFRSERVDEREGLGIRQVTFLFTDLKGSTAMYERLGDLNAYALVREHFGLLGAAVQEHSGAVVKTIGDAVMAAFHDPVAALTASLRIRDDIEAFNRNLAEQLEADGMAIIVRLGLHTGPCIAVTLNDRLDYFGRTVNLAARLESQSEGGGDIVMSEALAEEPGVAEIIAGLGATEQIAMVKGFTEPIRLRRIPARH